MKAIVVYPMNALANSQDGELEKFLLAATPTAVARSRSGGTPARRSDEERQQIMANPPDILLTNYVMLELILTRVDERPTRESRRQGLRFLVLDELHTYRGRQGADVALLVPPGPRGVSGRAAPGASGRRPRWPTRRIWAEQQAEIARGGVAASSARRCAPSDVIGETLQRATPNSIRPTPPPSTCSRERLQLRCRGPGRLRVVRRRPAFAVDRVDIGRHERGESGRLVRVRAADHRVARRHRRRAGGADRRWTSTVCEAAVEAQLLAGGIGASTPTPASRCSLSACTSSSPVATRLRVARAARDPLHHASPQEYVPGDRDEGSAPAGFLPRVRPGLLRRGTVVDRCGIGVRSPSARTSGPMRTLPPVYLVIGVDWPEADERRALRAAPRRLGGGDGRGPGEVRPPSPAP